MTARRQIKKQHRLQREEERRALERSHAQRRLISLFPENKRSLKAKEAQMRERPQPFLKFGRDHPQVNEAYELLARAAHEAGPLDEHTRQHLQLASGGGC